MTLKADYLLSGRFIYAIAMLGFGAVCLVYVDFLSSLQPVPESMPGYRALAVVTGVVLVSAGLGILTGIRLQAAALTLVAVFALGIVLLHVPSAFTNPVLLRSPWWIRTFESLAIAGAALILAGTTSDPVRESWVRAGRILFGISLPVFGALHFIYADNVASLVPGWYPWPLFWAYLTGVGHTAAGIAIAAGVGARLAATLAGFMYASWALTLHLARVMDHPPTYAGDRRELTSLFVCVAFWGAAWIVAASVPGKARQSA